MIFGQRKNRVKEAASEQDGTASLAVGRATRAAIDADAIMRIKSLPLRARVIVEGYYNGLHRSPFYGFSSEFSEYRQYSKGDDTRHIDWRLFARTDRHYLKRFEDETNRRCLLVVDQSRSMGFGSREYDKAAYTRTLAATFAHYLNLQRDSVGLVTYDEVINEYLPARHRPGHLRQLMGMLDRSPSGTGTDLVSALKQVASVAKKRGLIVIISDFLAPTDELRLPLAYLGSRGHEVWALRVLDPAEKTFEFSENATFLDLESGRQMFVDPAVAKDAYLQEFAAHEQQLTSVCADLGIDFTTLTTDAPFEHALHHWVARQNRLVGRTQRVRSNRGATQ